MKKSIKHLPKRTQEELEVIQKLILQDIKGCDMIILYGSYARGGYVLWDEKWDFDTHTTFQSDLDILVVLSSANPQIAEARLEDKVTVKYEKIFKHRRYAPPEFIVESSDKLNSELRKKQYFFTDIVKEGIMLYDTGNVKLSKPSKLSFSEIKEIAAKEFNTIFPDANVFLKNGYFNFNEGDYKIGSFILHQACERYYNSISLAFKNYKPRTHKLAKLGAMVKNYSRELSIVFPKNTDFEKRCYKLLCKAYIEARYNPDFVVTKEEYEYMLQRIEVLKEITERICTEKIQSYDLLIENE